MTRYSIQLYVLLLLILMGCTPGKEDEQQKRKPNLLVIMTDEHNFRTLGCYRDLLPRDQAFVWGDELAVETPYIDHLAEKGVLFSKFYAPSPVCSPSRSSFVSGLYPQHTGVPRNDSPMHDHIITFAEVLQQNGYATGYAGKWHLDGEGKPQWGPERKFGFSDNRYMFNRGHWKKVIDTPDGPLIDALDSSGEFNYDLNGADEKSFMTDYLTDKTLEFMERNKEGPFCYMLSYPDPHGPDEVRPPYDTMYADLPFTAPVTHEKPIENVPEWASKAEESEVDQSQYFGMVKCIDDNIGRLINYLKTNDLWENTVVVFTSDHGDLRGEHHRRNKGVPLEASAKVPFIVYDPSLKERGEVIKSAFNIVDFTPSILSLMDIEDTVKRQGSDFADLIMNPDKQSEYPDFTVMRSHSSRSVKWVAAVTSRYKLVLSEQDDPWLLDLKKDPNETINYMDSVGNGSTIMELSRQLKVYHEKYEDPFLDGTKMANEMMELSGE